MTVAAIIVAAGSGQRAGGDIPKQYQLVGDQPVIRHTLEIFSNHPLIDHIQVVIGEGHDEMYSQATAGLDLPSPVAGGATRQDSVFNGLCAVKPHHPDKVLIHDAARCFVSADLITSVIEMIGLDCIGAVPGLAVTDTLKRLKDGVISDTVSREALHAVQTPQGFDFASILAAHEKAATKAVSGLTDDAAIAEFAGHRIAIVPGDSRNIKLTTAEDIAVANMRYGVQTIEKLQDIRVGHGYDVHAFEAGDHVILCGVKIPHDASLKGHSDADVAMHTLTDAILGAIAEGDIGKHFPPSDPQWKAADSRIFLERAVELVREHGGMISHCDITVICERPKLRDYVDPMRENLAKIIGLDVNRISVKATTSEKLGFTGRQEGIAATATATVRLPI